MSTERYVHCTQVDEELIFGVGRNGSTPVSPNARLLARIDPQVSQEIVAHGMQFWSRINSHKKNQNLRKNQFLTRCGTDP